MIYEITIAYTTQTDGKVRKVKETYLADGIETFTEAEQLAHKSGELKNIDVIAIKRSRLLEICNKRETKNDKIYIAQLEDTFMIDGEEKTAKYPVALYAADMDAAHATITKYVWQGYDMSLRGLKETKIIGVIHY